MWTTNYSVVNVVVLLPRLVGKRSGHTHRLCHRLHACRQHRHVDVQPLAVRPCEHFRRVMRRSGSRSAVADKLWECCRVEFAHVVDDHVDDLRTVFRRDGLNDPVGDLPAGGMLGMHPGPHRPEEHGRRVI